MVSPGININSASNRNFFKRNYVDAVELITPNVYLQDDIDASGYEPNQVDGFINASMRVAQLATDPVSSVIWTSGILGTVWSATSSMSGMSQYLVPQNQLTNITPANFERNILLPLGKTFKEFYTSADFYGYLTSGLLSSISNYEVSNSWERTGGVYASNSSGTHAHLLGSLGLFYILNLSGDGRGYASQPSSVVAQALTDNIYFGKPLKTNDGVKALFKFIFLNYQTCTAWQPWDLITSAYHPSGVMPSTLSGEATSGIQNLKKIETLIDVGWSPQYSNRQDTRIKDAFDNFIDGSTDVEKGTLLTSLEIKGPFHRLLKAFSYSMFDSLEEAELLNLLYDIDECPAEYLYHIGRLIGWKMYGTDEGKQRLQLKNAVSLYKKTGTKESIQRAVNSLFSEDTFNVSGAINELWESYIPNIIKYSLLTDSTLFKDFTTWTEETAIAKGVVSNGKAAYSDGSMDENVNLVTDHILLYLIALHPDLFKIAGKPFPVQVLSGTSNPTTNKFVPGSLVTAGPLIPGVKVYLENPEFVFNYRGRDFPIPPWEQISYYTQCEVNDNFINDLRDLLTCFGVSESFADSVREYIKNNTIKASDSLRDTNGWLMFTSGSNDPPNLESILQDPTSKAVDALPLWNGKSSHFKFIMHADSFDFSKNAFTHDSKWAPAFAARLTKDFSPAHAIPESRLETSGNDYIRDPIGISATESFIINPDKSESYTGSGFIKFETSSEAGGLEKAAFPAAFAGAGVSAVHLNGVRRSGHNPLGRAIFRRDVDQLHLIHSGTVTAAVAENKNCEGGVVEVPRNTFRRRNYKNLLPTNGYYDRTGFNMPVSWDSSTIEHSYVGGGAFNATGVTPSCLGMLPLGYIPSAGSFQDIEDYDNLPEVYKTCEGLNSASVFSGVPTSASFPCRGLSSLGSDVRNTQYSVCTPLYVDRGQASDIIRTMHSIQERRKLEKANHYVSSNFSNYASSYEVFNPELSFANSSTESNGWFPSAMSDYHDFKFEREFHQVYDTYTDKFGRHSLSPGIEDLEGPTIFAHVYGFGIFNGNFNNLGVSSLLHHHNVIASSTETVSSLTLESSSFSGIATRSGGWSGSANGSYVVSAGSLIASAPMAGTLSSVEIRNNNIIKGVELIHPSGGSPANSFSITKYAPSLAKDSGNNYHIGNTLIKLKSIRGLSRLRFSTKEASGLQTVNPHYNRDDNLLLPDNKYRFNIRYLGGQEDGLYFGGVRVGAWIHTEIESGTFWTWTSNNKWEKYDTSDVSESFILDNSHYHMQPTTQTPQYFGRCGVAGYMSPTTSSNPSIVSEFSEDDYTTMKVDFHTFNEGLQRRELATEVYGKEFLSRPNTIDPDVAQRRKDIGYLHTEDQNYVIEFFMVPGAQNLNKFVIVDHVGLQNRTLYEKITYDVSGDWASYPFSVLRRGKKYINPTTDTYTQEDIRTIFKFFNSTVGVNHYSPYASRVAYDSSGTYGTSGGGRLSYRQQVDYYATNLARQANYNNLISMDVVN
jgi:hypothetical protein